MLENPASAAPSGPVSLTMVALMLENPASAAPSGTGVGRGEAGRGEAGRAAREFGRRHLAAKTPGSIVNIGASYAWTGGPGFAHSSAAKAGVKNMVESLAVEWAPYGIQINALVPGLFPHEDMTADIQENIRRSNDKERAQPAMRAGRPRELGWAATFLCSPFARFISGHTLVVDGANWQRRSLINPTMTPVREQMGKGPFTAWASGLVALATSAWASSPWRSLLSHGRTPRF